VGVSSVVKYQTLKDDGTPLTQRGSINFVATSTVATTLTDDSGNDETEVALSVIQSGIDHGSVSGLLDDDHLQYALLAGRAGGQNLNGGNASGESLTLEATSHSTKGNIVFETDEMGWTRPVANDNMIMNGNTIKATAGRFNYGWGENVFSTSMGSTNDGNIAIGINNLSSINDLAADYNIAIGTNVMRSLTSAGNNTAIGNEALYSITTGGGNTAMGAAAGRAITSGTNNFALGANTLRGGNITGSVAIGSEALRLMTSGDYNAAIGSQAGRNLVSGSDFVVGIGYQTLFQASGDFTIGIGTQAGYNAGARGVYLGNLAGYNETNADRLYIENSNTASPLIGGNFSSNYVGINTAVASLGAALHVTGTGATSGTVNAFFENSAGTDLMYLDNSGQLGIGTNLPARTLHVAGEMRVTDLTTDPPTRMVGADADGDFGEITVGSGLSLSAGTLTANAAAIDHGGLAGLSDDDHTQYLLLAGRATGQVATGGTASGDDLTLRSTTDATKGDIIIQDQGGNVILGGGATASNLRIMEASGSGTEWTQFRTQPQSASVTYILPADNGDPGEVLQTNGSGTLSWESGGIAPTFVTYTSATTTTYAIPAGAKTIDITCIGGGGGGGSGRKGATSEANTGGGGGGGGGYSRVTFVVSELSSSTLDITVGAGGAGGGSISSSSTNGSPGGYGEVTLVECSGFVLCAAGGGVGGGGGNTGASSAGTGATIGDVTGEDGGTCATTGTASGGSAAKGKGAVGGGAGGGIPTGGTPFKSGARPGKHNYGQAQQTGQGASDGANGSDATVDTQQITPGSGGPGGASSILTNGGGGGDGIQGGGGGGGGAALNGVGNSGAGGAGGDGFILLIVKY